MYEYSNSRCQHLADPEVTCLTSSKNQDQGTKIREQRSGNEVVHHVLSGEADEVRLRELCTELMGPLNHPGVAASPTDESAGGGSTAAASMAAASSSGRRAGPQTQGWQPEVLGLCKRTLLRTEVLRDIGRNRANQRLVNEFTELLSDLPK